MSTIEDLRAQIKILDKNLVATLAQRQQVCLEIGKLKSNLNVAIENSDQEQIQFDQYRQWASDYKLQPNYIYSLFKIIINESKNLQSKLFRTE